MRDEQIGLNYQATVDNQNAIAKLEERVKDLEEKESARARADHARSEHLDFVNSEGLGVT